ncbi:uncharacterized protein F4807DRAFT_419220 [Annulohypoxylon truncatum]|uniref:uncharacterized protein n=1 Tax=Annulohypoxylon truncatum TaxID=327061 RepID=UPI002007B856|nr:uncharacterized protein F4807DRAFT_419220 [Annulohypoxylon truncatum]KAI1211153.1 hypothetical protein F4807DRAFT_419220 [Annulohypoxylon truncatum]
MVTPGLPNSPVSPYPQFNISGPPSPLNPGPQSPDALETFPPPPPGPPPQNARYSNPPIPQRPISTYTSYTPTNSSTTPNPTHQISPGGTPYSPPVYMPPKETSNNRLPEKSPNSSVPLLQSYVQTSNPQPPSQPSPYAPYVVSSSPSPNTSPQPNNIETRFQSLAINNRPTTSPQPPASHRTPQTLQSGSQANLSNVPASLSLGPQISLPGQQIYELPAEDKSKDTHAEPALSTPSAVTSCIDSPLTFTTDWYWHPSAPDFLICSRCYVDHIHRTKFRDSFQSKRFDDGKARVCRLSKSRMRDNLFKDAITTGSLESALSWMHTRPQIPDCKGIDGVKGTVGIKWYKPKSGAIPGFVACQACYEDYILTNHFSANFEPAPPQPEGETWACDMAVPFIEKEYAARGKASDWAGFANETKARMSIKACPGRGRASTYGKKWFVPKAGPEGLVLCAACYCDQVIHTGEEAKWEVAESYEKATNKHVLCGMGIFSIRIAMSRAHETKDYALFWTAVRKIANEKFCEDDGIEEGIWHSFPSDPSNFGVCARCYVGIAEPLDVARFFVRKREAQPSGTKWRCCFSVAHPRFRQFMQQLLEMYYTLNPRSFGEFAAVYASMPICPRDEDAKDKRWYGWMDCTICPECYHEFARHTPLAAKMHLNNTLLETTAMCEMYSPRMRNLYKECSDASPPDAGPLLAYSAQRRLVWAETVPQMRMMLFRAKMALKQQSFLNTTSTFYNSLGMLQQTSMGSSHTYGAAGVGYGYANMNLLQGAMYGQQAMAVSSSAVNGGTVMLVGQLEQRWRAVE